MYCDFYKLRERPFNVTSDPKFLYLNSCYREALASLHYGVTQRRGFITLIGEAGTGKTTLLKKLLDDLDEGTRTVFVFNTNVSFDEILEYIFHEFDLPVQSGKRLYMLQRLNQFLLDELRCGRNVALLIDEAQDLEFSVLEDLRLLSNLETAKEKILQIVLSGQPELGQKLGNPSLRQLRQRIAINCRLQPLSRDELTEYIESRLEHAGSPDLNLFTREAEDRIYELSKGIPRVVNIVCDNALVIGYALGKKRIGSDIISEAAADLYPAEGAEPVEPTGAVSVLPQVRPIPLPKRLPAALRSAGVRGGLIAAAAIAATVGVLSVVRSRPSGDGTAAVSAPLRPPLEVVAPAARIAGRDEAAAGRPQNPPDAGRPQVRPEDAATAANREAELAAAREATTKAEAAKKEIELAAAREATKKAEAAKKEIELAAAREATKKAEAAKKEIELAAAREATRKAEAAKKEIELAAAREATRKAEAAKKEMELAAAREATRKAEAVKPTIQVAVVPTVAPEPTEPARGEAPRAEGTPESEPISEPVSVEEAEPLGPAASAVAAPGAADSDVVVASVESAADLPRPNIPIAAPPPREGSTTDQPALEVIQPAELSSRLAGTDEEIVTARAGDSMSTIATRKYGTANMTVLDLMKMANPGISNIDEIGAGQEVRVPKLDGGFAVIREGDGRYAVLVVSTPVQRRANEIESGLRKHGYHAQVRRTDFGKGRVVYRVLIPDLNDRGAAVSVGRDLQRVAREDEQLAGGAR